MLWWQSGVVYQIYPRSFADSNGDGVGDLQGIISRLDYLSETLGVDAIWLSPHYPSPQDDFGYDVADYVDVDPMYGDLADFDLLVKEAHARNLRVIVDYVICHSSDRHPWFIESASNTDNPKRDWYIWRPEKADGSLPNNWLSIFGGKAWTKHPTTGEYYLHSFLASQPDLNWRNPELERAMFDVLRFWLDRGVDGFRIDVARRAVKDAYLRDNPEALVIDPTTHKFDPIWSAQEHIHDDRQTDMHVIYGKFRALLDSYQERYSVGEIHEWDWDSWASWYGEGDELHMPFNFALLAAGTDAIKIRNIITGMEGAIPDGAWPNWVAGNHDEPRMATRLGGLAEARAMAVLLLTLRGTPTLYYGDEVGMTELPILIGEERDPAGLRKPGWGRDGCRSPMQWDPAGGFSSATTSWLPTNSNTATVNVESQLGDPASTLELYRALLALRRLTPALNSGGIVLEPLDKAVLAYKRVAPDGDTVSVAVNLSSGEHPQPFTGTVLVSTSPALIGEPAPKVLAPWEAVVIGN